jgi:5,5'-dehydrodivanillate O-demethylase
MFWQPVQRASDLAPGRTKPIRIMGEDFTLYRGEGGEPHLLPFRCAHRGTQLSTGWVEGDNLRCFYHGWTYGPDGQCIDQPAEPEPFSSRIKLRGYPVKEYLGLIFAYLGDGAPPPFPFLLDFEETDYPRDVSALVWPCNYFTQLDNAVDPSHTSITHWQFDRPLMKAVIAQEVECGLLVKTVDGGVEKTPSYFHMPNAHEWGGPPRGGKAAWNYARGWRVPVDDFHHIRFGLEVVATHGDEARLRGEWREKSAVIANQVAESALRGDVGTRDLTLAEYPGPALTNIQDYIILVGLGRIAEKPNTEHPGGSDVGVLAMRKLWARELAALADGRSLTEWHRPERLWRDIEAQAELAGATGC